MPRTVNEWDLCLGQVTAAGVCVGGAILLGALRLWVPAAMLAVIGAAFYGIATVSASMAASPSVRRAASSWAIPPRFVAMLIELKSAAELEDHADALWSTEMAVRATAPAQAARPARLVPMLVATAMSAGALAVLGLQHHDGARGQPSQGAALPATSEVIVVVRDQMGQPVNGAKVEAIGRDDVSAISDAHGSALLKLKSRASVDVWRLNVSKPGYGPAESFPAFEVSASRKSPDPMVVFLTMTPDAGREAAATPP